MKRCLVVDDSDVIRKVAKRLLENLGYMVDDAESGAAGLAVCRAQMPEIILLDWHMTEMSAFDFLAALRALPHGRKPIVIYCTTENDQVDIDRAFAAGADDYLLKPFDRESVRAKFAEAARAA
jgi:two-component system chemotaxis response regulator CheY